MINLNAAVSSPACGCVVDRHAGQRLVRRSLNPQRHLPARVCTTISRGSIWRDDSTCLLWRPLHSLSHWLVTQSGRSSDLVSLVSDLVWPVSDHVSLVSDLVSLVCDLVPIVVSDAYICIMIKDEIIII